MADEDVSDARIAWLASGEVADGGPTEKTQMAIELFRRRNAAKRALQAVDQLQTFIVGRNHRENSPKTCQAIELVLEAIKAGEG